MEQKKIVLDDYLNIRALSALAWAPDGERAALIVTMPDKEKNGYNCNLWLKEKDDSLRPLTSRGDVRSFIWDCNDAIVFPTVRDNADRALLEKGEDITSFYRLSLNGGCAEKLFSVPLKATVIGKLNERVYILKARLDFEKHDRLNNLTGITRDEELARIKDEHNRFAVIDEYPFWANGVGMTNKTRVGLWLYNTENGQLKQITDRNYDVEAACVVPDEGLVLYHGREFNVISDFRTGINVYDYTKDETINVVPQGIYRMRQINWLNGKVVFAGTDMKEYNYSQTPALWTADPATKEIIRLCPEALSIGNPVGSDARYGGGTVFKTEGDKLYLISGEEDRARLIAINPDGTIDSLVDRDGSVDMFDIKNGNILFVSMFGMRPQELYALTEEGEKKISTFNDAYADERSIVMPEEIRFTDPDGFEIHGFVLKPADYREGVRYPAILDIHGGPRLTYGKVYYHEMQYWANHGYFVFFCNPRGSDARGDEFAYIRGKYGTVEYANIMQFTDEVLAKYPEIDPERVGVTGGSYGGFMTNWIIGHTDRFAAAASQRSISNFVSMEGTSDCGRLFLDGHIGAFTGTDLKKVWAQSPLSAVDNCTTPTLFIHSEEDYRCWKIEGLQMFNAIRSHGVDARMCLFKGENHELSRSGKPVNRTKRLTEITRWMDRYLKKD